MEKNISVSQAREKLGDLVEQVQYQGDTYIINRNGKPAAAVVPLEVYESWKLRAPGVFRLPPPGPGAGEPDSGGSR